MTVDELRAILNPIRGDLPVEIEIECRDGRNRRAVSVTAAGWKTKDRQMFIIEGPEPEPRKVRDEPQA